MIVPSRNKFDLFMLPDSYRVKKTKNQYMKPVFFNFLFIIFTLSSFGQIKTEQGSVTFKIRNAGISVDGKFSAPICILTFDPNNLSQSKLTGTIVTSSINTNNASRDGHLRKPEYFDVAKYPVIKIESTSVLADAKGKYKAVCNVYIKGVTKSVSIPFTYNVSNGTFTMEGQFIINRRDFGVGDKSIILSDNVNITIKVIGKI
jgi:polyisoprenoid-binding protein YceI